MDIYIYIYMCIYISGYPNCLYPPTPRPPARGIHRYTSINSPGPGLPDEPDIYMCTYIYIHICLHMYSCK